MTHDEILQGLYDHTLRDAPEVRARRARARGRDGAESMLYDALILARGGRRTLRARRLLRPGDADAGVAERTDILSLPPRQARASGHLRDGHGRAAVHDIGKNLVNIMLERRLHRDRPRRQRRAREVRRDRGAQARHVSFAFLTTTMPMFKASSTHSKVRPPRRGDRDGRRRASDAGVRGRRRRRRLRGGRLDRGRLAKALIEQRRQASVPA